MENINYGTIYKINYLIEDIIKTIYVFYGKSPPNMKINLNELFKEDPSNSAFMDKTNGKPIFDEEELNNIKLNNINVIFSEQQIHFDDTIGMIKLKIFNEFNKMFSIEEIYLFCLKKEKLNPVSVYKTLSQNKKIDITKLRLEQFLYNIVRDPYGNPTDFAIQDKEFYNYDDILSLNLNNNEWWVSKVLGQKFFVIENEYPFITNPYDVTHYDAFFESSLRKSLTTLNNRLLLSSGPIVNNNLYLCLASDVLKKNVEQEYTLKIYYPFLFSNNINSLDDLIEKRPTLIEENKKVFNETTLSYFENIDLFYDIYKYKTEDLNYHLLGVKSIIFIIKPNYNINIPLDIIFKNLQSSQEIPLIKYNSSSRKDNLYRLYSKEITRDGKKIPFLPKASIFKLIKNIGKKKSVALFLEYMKNNIQYQIILEIDENCIITISSEFNTITDISIIEDVFVESINPVINQINSFISQNGYSLTLFNRFTDENIEIKDLNYQFKIEINKKINLNKLKGCITSAFNIETLEIDNQIIEMRFKRVSNFNKMTSQEAFIIEKQKKGYVGQEILESLMTNYNLTFVEAEILLKNFASETQIEYGSSKRDISIKVNPGFKVTILIDKFTYISTINIENIDDIYYLQTIPIYVDTLIRLTQDKTTTLIPVDYINKLCGASEKKDIVMLDIISSREESLSSSGSLSPIAFDIDQDDNIEYFEIEKIKNNMELFFGDYDFNKSEEQDNDINDLGKFIEGGENNEETPESNISEGSLSPLENDLISFENEEDEELSPLVNADISFENEEDEDAELSQLENVEQEDQQEEEAEESEDLSPLENVEEEEEDQQYEEAEDLSPFVNEEGDQQDEEAEDLSPLVNEEEEAEAEDLSPLVNEKDISNIPTSSKETKDVNYGTKDETINENINIDGLKLNNPYYFQDRILKRDPVLILSKKTGNFNAYSRVCPSTTRRQPVILTQKEKDEIDKKYKGFLKDEDVIKYGSNPDNKYYYICPRYWCLKTNSAISEEDVKSGKCGKIIPKNKKEVIPGHYVYEFYTPPNNNKDYKRYPGFQVDNHPKGYCLPCCFDKWNTESQIERRNKCSGKPIVEKETKPPSSEIINSDIYIIGPEKFPLSQLRWGYLPVSIQKALNDINADCNVEELNLDMKENYNCMFRHGVENNEKQSFVACIADCLFFARKSSANIQYKIPTIKQMKELIINSLSLDNYIKFQNGNLVNNFKKMADDMDMEMDIDKYKNTKTFLKIDVTNKVEYEYFKSVVASFENFINFMKNDDVNIDHTYLWDIICNPNKNLFVNGLNLVIFEIINNDITSNLELLCPSNHYSNIFYESRKPILILIKQNNYYEPIYSYKKEAKKIFIGKVFSEYDPTLSKKILSFIKLIIKPYLQNKCVPLNSLPNVYTTKQPLLLTKLITILHKKKYEVINQVVNYNSKVIGVIAMKNNIKGFVPCYPSSIIYAYDYVYMLNKDLWNKYNETIDFLIKLSSLADEIHCKPIFKVVEDEHIVGILTETNQFIQLSEPFLLINARDDIPVLNSNPYADVKNNEITLIDNIINTTSDPDTERVEYINKIKAETNLYDIFRNTIRILLNDYKNIKFRGLIEIELKKNYLVYSQKLQNISDLLFEISKNALEFSGNKELYENVNMLSTCINKDKNSCSVSSQICVMTESDCKIILPKENLITGHNNKIIYFGKMADELIRFSRITKFILEPETYLTFGNVNYNLKDDEILIMQSLINQEYFENLTPYIQNEFINFNTKDDAYPFKTIIYDNEVEIDYNKPLIDVKKCEIVENKIKSLFWKKCFPATYNEVEFTDSSACTFFFISELLKRIFNIDTDVSTLKNELYNEYLKYLGNYKDNIIDILIIEGKKTLGDQVRNNIISFQDFIYSDTYFLTTLDIWLFIEKYKIPTVFISSKTLLQTQYNSQLFVGYGSITDKLLFIVIPGLRPENVPKYKVIINENKELFISVNHLINISCAETIENSFRNVNTVEIYLKNYVKQTKTKYIKKIKLNIIDESPEAPTPTKTKTRRVKLNIMEESPEVAKPLPPPPSLKLKKVKLNIIEPVDIDELTDNIEFEKFEIDPSSEKKRKSKKRNKYVLKTKTKRVKLNIQENDD